MLHISELSYFKFASSRAFVLYDVFPGKLVAWYLVGCRTNWFPLIGTMPFYDIYQGYCPMVTTLNYLFPCQPPLQCLIDRRPRRKLDADRRKLLDCDHIKKHTCGWIACASCIVIARTIAEDRTISIFCDLRSCDSLRSSDQWKPKFCDLRSKCI